jgi:hypothetical protein
MNYIDPPTCMHPGRDTTEKDRANARRIESVLIHEPPLSFEEMLQEYRKIEAELVERAGGDEFDVIETKRRIAEWILTAAFLRDQPFHVCENAWNNLVVLGFSSRFMKCSMTCTYADCCWENEQDQVGLTVLEPVILELEQWLSETILEPQWRADYESLLRGLQKRRDEFTASIKK